MFTYSPASCLYFQVESGRTQRSPILSREWFMTSSWLNNQSSLDQVSIILGKKHGSFNYLVRDNEALNHANGRHWTCVVHILNACMIWMYVSMYLLMHVCNEWMNEWMRLTTSLFFSKPLHGTLVFSSAIMLWPTFQRSKFHRFVVGCFVGICIEGFSKKVTTHPLEHTPGNPLTQLWKDSLYNLLVKV